MAARPTKNSIKFGTASGKFKYSAKNLEGIDPDVQELFYKG